MPAQTATSALRWLVWLQVTWCKACSTNSACAGAPQRSAMEASVSQLRGRSRCAGWLKGRIKLLAHNAQKRRAFCLHGRPRLAAVPRQQRRQGLPACKKGHATFSALRCIAHQINAVRVGPLVPPHTARVDDRHEYETNFFKLLAQQLVPFQPEKQSAHVVQDDLRTDTLQPVNTAKKSDGRRFAVQRPYVGRKHRELRERRAPGRYFAYSLNIKTAPGLHAVWF